MELRKLSKGNEDFDALWDIMVEAFPEDERHSKSTQQNMFSIEHYSLYGAYDQELVGLAGVWEYDSFVFVEHLAVRNDVRGKGYGTNILQHFLNDQLTVLEVELPEDEVSRKRIHFYNRLQFHLNNYEYIQPAYEPTTNPVPMKIMSYPREITLEEYESIRLKLHTDVYGLSEPLLQLPDSRN